MISDWRLEINQVAIHHHKAPVTDHLFPLKDEATITTESLCLRAYWRQILLSLIFLLCLTSLSLVIPGIIRQVIDVGLSQGEVTLLIQSAAIILVIGITRAIILYFQCYLNEVVRPNPKRFSFPDHTQTGQLISRCIEDVRSTRPSPGAAW